MLKKSLFSVYSFRFLTALLLLSLSRITLYFFNTSYFYDINIVELLSLFLYGIRFDISILAMINMPVIILLTIPFPFRGYPIYQKIVEYIFYFSNIIGLSGNFADLAYFSFTLKRTTGDIFSFVSQEGTSMLSLLPQFIIDFWFEFILWITFSIILILISKKFKFQLIKTKVKFLQYYPKNILYFLLFSFITIIGIRGGFQLKPISLINASKVADAQNIPLILSTPFSIIKTINQKGLPEKHYFTSENELNAVFNPIKKPLASDTTFKPVNVVIFILESFSSEHMTSLNGSKQDGYTPFLDSLMKHSLVHKSFANGKRSIEAMPAILSSLPTLMNVDYISSIYSTNKIKSLAHLLHKKSYSSSFFHGGNNGTMSFNSFAEIAGIENYYGRDEYNNDKDYDGKWGIFDEEFFQYVAKIINTESKPFFTTIFSLSAHHPYTIPKKHIGKFKKGALEIQETIMYTDYALKKFFDTAKKTSWFKNTLFVFTADHTSEAYSKESHGRIGSYSIPIIFYKEDSELRGFSEDIAQQIDIMPSILDYLNYDLPYLSFGKSILDTTNKSVAISYLNNSYQLINDKFALHFEEDKAIGFYNYISDPLLEHNLLGQYPEEENEMILSLKAIIQQYNNRLIHNQLTAN